MSDPPHSFITYRAVYSEFVQNQLKDLLNKAGDRGLGRVTLAAVKEMNRRLTIYPQFGEPKRNLAMAGQVLWAGAVPPLFVQYIIDEINHVVYVVIPIKPLPNTGLD